ncbi:MAG: energy transducer TonB [Thiomicrospira sp.]|nr:energy transducer TonB [Thiomicrospira sp.]NCN67757.1 energy transducer TonB [Thiomicrospira sp.]
MAEAAEKAELQYTQQLAQHLSRLAQKNYPRRAKRRLQQGDVILQFTLHPNGQIQQLKLIQPSNHPLLNQAALDIIRKRMAYQYLPFPPQMPKNPMRIQVPINYILR